MMTLTHVDTHRIEVRYYGRLLAYGICDLWGWSLMQLYNGLWRQVERVDAEPGLAPLRDRAAHRLSLLGQNTFPPAVKS